MFPGKSAAIAFVVRSDGSESVGRVFAMAQIPEFTSDGATSKHASRGNYRARSWPGDAGWDNVEVRKLRVYQVTKYTND